MSDDEYSDNIKRLIRIILIMGGILFALLIALMFFITVQFTDIKRDIKRLEEVKTVSIPPVQQIAGAQGLRGIQGNTGIPGKTGDTGAAGKDGAKGDIGAKGDTGEQGIQGEKGAAGKQGLPGKPAREIELCYDEEHMLGQRYVGTLICSAIEGAE